MNKKFHPTLVFAVSLLISGPALAIGSEQHDPEITTSIGTLANESNQQTALHAQRLSSVRRIYVASLGASESAEFVRQKLINSLIETGVFRVVDSVDEADATLAGAGLLSSFLSVSNGEGGTGYTSSLVVRLVGRNGQMLWTNTVESGGRRHRRSARSNNSASTYVADETVKALMKQIRLEQESSQIGSVSQPVQ